MTDLSDKSAQTLRQRAENNITTSGSSRSKKKLNVETSRLQHELEVHQIELDMQNDELCRSHHELLEQIGKTDETQRHADLYRALTATDLFGFWLIDSAGQLLDVNDTYCRMSGYRKDELLQLSVSDLEAAESAEETARHMQQLITNGTDHFESEHITKDGWIYCVEISTVFLRHQNNIVVFIRDISDRKISEAELLLRESRYYAVVEDQSDLICRYRPDGRLTFVNGAYCRYFGKNYDELINQNYIPHIPEPDLSIIFEQLHEITPDRQLVDVEHRVIMPDGTVRWQQWTHRGIYAAERALIEYQAVGRDITDRKQAELERILNEQRLGLLLELNLLTAATEDEILNFALDAALVTVQSRFAFIGFVDDTETVMTVQTWSKDVMAQCTLDSNNLVLPLAEVGLLGECVRQRVPVVLNDYASPHPAKNGCPVGHVPIKRFLAVPIFDGDRIVAVVAAANKEGEYIQSDINALTLLIEKMFHKIHSRRVQAELRMSSEKLKAYVDGSFDVIFVLNAKGEFQFVSSAWERHFDQPVEKVLGNNLSLFVHPDDISSCTDYLTYILDGGRNRTSPPYRVQHADGSWRWFIANGSRNEETKNEWRFIGVGRDITESKQAEEELQLAKIAAEAANRAKSEFLATMSHEIRTPLSALLGNIELLESSPFTPQQLEPLKNCRIASNMLLQVINDVLDFSKIEAGKLELINEVFSVSNMARQLVRTFAGSADKKGLEITLSLASDLPAHVLCDQHRLCQIVTNLVSNAIKFTDHGQVSIEINVDYPSSNQTPDSVVLLISVCDTGPGIPFDKQTSIFESFTQVEQFSTRRQTGTGLGLAICRRLSEMMGGTISMESVPGEGSVFTLSLPVTVSQSPSQQMRTPLEDTIVTVPRNILLADDEELGRVVAVALLQRQGHRVTAVDSGYALLEALQQEQFDIVLSDISMPDMDGMEVVRITRSGECAGINTTTPIIALTAHAFADDRVRFMACGFNDIALKPVDFDELLRKIDYLCSNNA